MPYKNTAIANTSDKVSTEQLSGFQSIFVSGTGNALVNPLILEASSEYYLSSFIKVSKGSFNFVAREINPIVDLYKYPNITETSFKQYDTVFKTGTAVAIDVIISGTTGTTNEGWADKFVLAKNVVTLNTTTDWNGSDCTVASDTNDGRLSDACVKLTATSDGGYGYCDQIVTVNGQEYTFNGYIKVGAADDIARIMIYDAVGDTFIYSGTNQTSTSYSNIYNTFKAVSSGTQIRVYLEASGDICYLDDFSLLPVVELDAYSEITSTLTNSYGYDKWLTNSVGSILVDGGDIYSIGISSGTSLNNHQGSILFRYMPMFAYDNFVDDANLIYLENFLKIYYDASSYKFVGSVYNGSEYVVSGCETDAVWFPSGTWLDIAFTYDNTIGTFLIVSGSACGVFNGAWPSQNLPDLLCIGCISGTNYGRAEGYMDDLNFYPYALIEDDIVKYFNSNNSSE